MNEYPEAFNIWWNEHYSGQFGTVMIMEQALMKLAYSAWLAAIEHTYNTGE